MLDLKSHSPISSTDNKEISCIIHFQDQNEEIFCHQLFICMTKVRASPNVMQENDR